MKTKPKTKEILLNSRGGGFRITVPFILQFLNFSKEDFIERKPDDRGARSYNYERMTEVYGTWPLTDDLVLKAFFKFVKTHPDGRSLSYNQFLLKAEASQLAAREFLTWYRAYLAEQTAALSKDKWPWDDL
jgi:hypothetical protein